jgi:small subunit ribosomal protein S16
MRCIANVRLTVISADSKLMTLFFYYLRQILSVTEEIMVKIRLSRFGTRNRPYYHIVVADSEYPRDGRFLEKVGTYDPHKPITDAKLNLQRIEYWQGVGALTTDTVEKIIRESKKIAVPANAS